jgi:hypothetical protein
MQTHTTPTPTKSRYNRHNLPPETAGFLALINPNKQIQAVIAAAMHIESKIPGGEFNQLYVATHGQTGADEPDIWTSTAVELDSYRCTVKFTDNCKTVALKKLKEGWCWAEISIRAKGPTSHSPEIMLHVLDEQTWEKSTDAADKFKIPQLGANWDFAPNILEFAEMIPNAWHLLVSAASSLGRLKVDSWPKLPTPPNSEINFLNERATKLRDAAKKARFAAMLNKLPADMRESFIKQVLAK